MFTATARSIDGTLRNEVDVNGRHTLVTDEPESVGGTNAGPAPHELVPAILAACVSTMIVLYARRHDWPSEGVSVEATYDPEVTPRPVELTIHVPEGLDEAQIKRLRRVAEACPVRRAMEAGFSFRETISV
jgi:putative redox protein